MHGFTKRLRWLAVVALLALGIVWAGSPRPALAQSAISSECTSALAGYSAEWSAILSGTVSPESIASIVPSLGAWLSHVQSICTAAELEVLDSQSLAQIQFLLGSLANCGALGGTWSWDAGGCTISVDSSIVIGENQSLAGLFHLINYGTIDNFGAISLGGSVLAISNHGTINNHNVIAITSGVPAFGNLGFTGHVNGFLRNYGTINNDGTIRTEGERFTDGDHAGFDEYGIFLNYGVTNNDGRLVGNGGIIANGDSDTAGTINNRSEITTTSLFGNDGVINNDGLVNIYGRFSNGDTVPSSTINNDGTINIFGLFGNSGLVRNRGTLHLDPMSIDDLGNFVVDGTIIAPFPYFYNNPGSVEQDCAAVFTGAATWQFEGNEIVNSCPDNTPPAVTPVVGGAPGQNGWYIGDVTVSWTVTDAESAITSTDGCDQTAIVDDTTGLTLTCTAASAGGTTSQSVTIQRDATPPTVSVTGVTEGATYVLGAVPDAGCAATDALSGVATSAGLTLSGGNADGSGIFTATCDGAADNAGNRGSSAGVTYTVGTPAVVVDTLETDITALVSTDVLKRGEANRLTKSLDKMLRSLKKNRTADACRQLDDFIADVTLSTPDPLDAATAEALLRDAAAMYTALGCEAVVAGQVRTAFQPDADAPERVFLPLVNR